MMLNTFDDYVIALLFMKRMVRLGLISLESYNIILDSCYLAGATRYHAVYF